MFSKWFVGVDKAFAYSSFKQLVEEDDLVVFEDDLSVAVIEVIQLLDTFKSLFTEDSWQGVIALSIFNYYLHTCILIVTRHKLIFIPCSKFDFLSSFIVRRHQPTF